MDLSTTNVPSAVTVIFPKSVNGSVVQGFYTKTVTLAELALTAYGDTIGRAGEYLIRSDTIANFSQSGTALNASNITSLAKALAKAFYLWRLSSIEAVFEGAVPWESDGLHDVEWTHAGSICTHVHVSRWLPETF